MQAKHYVLGGHTFDNVNEYWDAQHDMKVIEIIKRNLDLSNPEVAIKLYNMIRDGKIVFSSPIGAEFTEHVTDILADKSVNLIDTKKTIDNAEKKVKKQRRIGIAIVALAIVAALVFGLSQFREIINTRSLESMAKATRAAKVDSQERAKIAAQNAKILQKAAIERRTAMLSGAENTNSKGVKPVNQEELTVLPEYKDLLAQNGDLKGWLYIKDTNVDYPVLQRSGDSDNSYYLRRSFDQKDDTNGSLFIDYRSDIVNPTENTIIYGHNMNSGKMFGDLKNYLDESYYFDHKQVKFDTLYEEREYEIVAVCLSKVQDSKDSSFRYYNFIDAANKKEWEAFVENVNALSVFSVDVDLEYGDEVLTLSTCNNYTQDGRLFLVAKRKI